MRKIVGAVIVVVGFVFAHGVWLAQNVPSLALPTKARRSRNSRLRSTS
jgi:hypothetical protein